MLWRLVDAMYRGGILEHYRRLSSGESKRPDHAGRETTSEQDEPGANAGFASPVHGRRLITDGGKKNMNRQFMITLCGLFVASPGVSQGSNEWIQGVWSCEQYTSNPVMQCRAQGQTRYTGSNYASETSMVCNTGSMQASAWGTWSLKGKGNILSITFTPKGSVPAGMKLKPSTKTIQVSEDRQLITSSISTRLEDGTEISEESRCRKIQ